jgi:uncharacterized protein (TIGR02996 family)
MTDGYALLRAIEAHPEEDTPRLAYADWLDEQGESPRAEFIQCDYARAAPKAMGPLLGQFDALYRRHADAWLKQLPGQQFNKVFVRGFLDPVHAAASNFVWHAETYAAVAPLHHLRLFKTPLMTEKVATCPQLGLVRRLDLTSNSIGVGHAQKFLRSPLLGNLRAINFTSNHLGIGGCKALAAAELPALESLVLDYNQIGDRGLESVLAAPWFPHLKCLSLRGCKLTGASVAELARSPHAAGLESLNLSCAFEVPAEALALLAGGAFRGLRILKLYSCNVTDAVIEAWAASPVLANLRELDLSEQDRFTHGALLTALDTPTFRNLTHLFLKVYGVDPSTVAVFRRRIGDGFNQPRPARPWYE